MTWLTRLRWRWWEFRATRDIKRGRTVTFSDPDAAMRWLRD